MHRLRSSCKIAILAQPLYVLPAHRACGTSRSGCLIRSRLLNNQALCTLLDVPSQARVHSLRHPHASFIATRRGVHMATIVHEGPAQDRRMFFRRAGDQSRVRSTAVVRDVEGMRVSWGGIWGGVFMALGVMLLLAALGVAVGISAVDPTGTDPQP